MRIKTTYGKLQVGDRFFSCFASPESLCRRKTASGKLTHFADGKELYCHESWENEREVWVDAEEAHSFEDYSVDIAEKLKQQAAEIERLKTLTSTGHCPVCGGYVGELISSTDEKRQVNDEN